jgi:very-short-patch-repair endonuclease
LIIELDGDQHGTDKALDYDNKRTDFITAQGYKLIRIPNGYIYKELNAVLYNLQLILQGKIDANEFFKNKY